MEENPPPEVVPEPLRAPLPDFRTVFKEQAPFVWRTLRYFGVKESDLEDVSQDVFVVVHRRLADFEGRSTVRTWLYRICANVAANYRTKAHRRREQLSDQVPEQEARATQTDGLERKQARELLAGLLESLDEDKRAVFVLYEVEQMPMPEVVAAVGCPLQTGYSRLQAARKQLERELNQMKAVGRLR